MLLIMTSFRPRKSGSFLHWLGLSTNIRIRFLQKANPRECLFKKMYISNKLKEKVNECGHWCKKYF